MSRTKKIFGVGLALAGVVSLHAEATLLPELSKHREFAQRAAELGNEDALRAATEVLAIRQVSYRLPANLGANEKRAFHEAIQQWERLMNRDILFVEAFKFQQPNVEVSFVANLGGNGQHYGGFTKWKRSISQDAKGRYVSDVDAKMQIRNVQPNGKAMTVDQMRHAVMHEFGHLLGLDDSSHVGDVMGPLDLGRPVGGPNKDEVNELKRLRAEVRALKVSER